MDIEKLYEALNNDEKKKLQYIVIKELKTTMTSIAFFVEKNKDIMSVKLKNVLIKFDDNATSIEQIDPKDLFKIRNVGKNTVDEFIKLRGY